MNTIPIPPDTVVERLDPFQATLAKRYRSVSGILQRELAIREETSVIMLARGRYGGGVYRSSTGDLVAESQLTRWLGRLQHLFPSSFVGAPEQVSEETDVVYMGTLFAHYGHFMLESLARAWSAAAFPERYRLAWSCAAGNREPAPWQRELMTRLFPDRQMLFFSKSTSFHRIAVPEPAFQIQWSAHPWFVRPFETFAASIEEPGPTARLYLTRANLDPALRMISGERAIEAIFTANGYEILAPESVPVLEQVRAFRRAEEISGFIGTAFHNLVYARRGTRCVVFCRGQPNLNYLLIDRLKDLASRYADVSCKPGWNAVEDEAVRAHSIARDILPDFHRLQDVLTKHGLNHPMGGPRALTQIRTLALLQHWIRIEQKIRHARGEKASGAPLDCGPLIDNFLAKAATTDQ